jgi:hypothetical protein
MARSIPVLKDELEAMLQVRRVQPLAPSDGDVPDGWLSLLTQLHGRSTQTLPPILPSQDERR